MMANTNDMPEFRPVKGLLTENILNRRRLRQPGKLSQPFHLSQLWLSAWLNVWLSDNCQPENMLKVLFNGGRAYV